MKGPSFPSLSKTLSPICLPASFLALLYSFPTTFAGLMEEDFRTVRYGLLAVRRKSTPMRLEAHQPGAHCISRAVQLVVLLQAWAPNIACNLRSLIRRRCLSRSKIVFLGCSTWIFPPYIPTRHERVAQADQRRDVRLEGWSNILRQNLDGGYVVYQALATEHQRPCGSTLKLPTPEVIPCHRCFVDVHQRPRIAALRRGLNLRTTSVL